MLNFFLPINSYDIVNNWILETDTLVEIKNPRKTKSGDFKIIQNKSIITINNNLNPYAFLITLTHELAHAYVYKKYYNLYPPHGKKWKNIFSNLLQILIHEDIFPSDILKPLIRYSKNPLASTFSDFDLSLTLSKYDEIKKLKILNLNRGTEFVFNNQIFIKEEKLRKRYRCINKKNNKVYFFHPLAEISVLE
tara:strand:- start:100 stop:678 length:579 start_codon:yes stop_codon:yes gene_type:complete